MEQMEKLRNKAKFAAVEGPRWVRPVYYVESLWLMGKLWDKANWEVGAVARKLVTDNNERPKTVH
jgi:hypothetical protein